MTVKLFGSNYFMNRTAGCFFSLGHYEEITDISVSSLTEESLGTSNICLTEKDSCSWCLRGEGSLSVIILLAEKNSTAMMISGCNTVFFPSVKKFRIKGLRLRPLLKIPPGSGLSWSAASSVASVVAVTTQVPYPQHHLSWEVNWRRYPNSLVRIKRKTFLETSP